MTRLGARLTIPALSLALLSACGPAGGRPAAHPTSPGRTVLRTPAVRPAVHRSPARPRVPSVSLPLFSASFTSLTAAQLPYSWHQGCPVPPAALVAAHLTFWGFDGHAHTGVLVVSRQVAAAVVTVFRRLYADRFPIRRMVPVDYYHGSDDASVAADNTAGFNCRLAVTTGAASWSMHAYGEAIDVDPVENPYLENGRVIPPNGAPYVNRTDVRPGMAYPGGVLFAAFASVGWGWGGYFQGSPDYQHFSVNGR